MWLLFACVPDDPPESASPEDSADSAADTAHTGETGDTGDSEDTGDSDDTSDSGDTGEPWRPEPPVFAGNVFYAGDPHAHTGFSGDASAEDAALCPTCGRFDGVFEFARGMGLSWLALSDHTNGTPAGTAAGIEEQLTAVLAANDFEHGFLTVPAAEVWFTDPTGDLGHKTVLMLGDPARVANVTLADLQPGGGDNIEVSGCADIWSWAAELQNKAGPVILVPHHPAGRQPMPTRWSCADEGWQPVVEVYSEHGNSLGDAYDPLWSGTVDAGTVASALSPTGYALKMGFVAGTDSHDTLPGEVCGLDRVRTDQSYGGGLTIAVMPEGTPILRQTLFDAIQARSTYATSGPIVPMNVVWESGGLPLGGLGHDFALPAGQDLDLRVQVAPPYDAAVVLVEAVGPTARYPATLDGAGGWALSLPAGTVPEYLFPVVTLDGDTIYGGTGCDDGGASTVEYLWGSPSWISG